MRSGVRARLLDLISVRGRIESAEPVGRMWSIRVTDVPGLAWRAGQQIRVHVNDLLAPQSWLRPRDVLRTYSVWDYDAAEGVLDLRVLDHGDGPGVRWARSVRPGQEVTFGRPEGDFTLRPGPYHLFVGEETASVAFGPMLRTVGEPAYGVIEVADENDRLPLAGDLTWRYRGAAPAAASPTLLRAVRELDLPSEPGVAYVAGEARSVQAVRAHLVKDRGWPRRSVVVRSFWTPGKRGME